jgi:hypothetical protein
MVKDANNCSKSANFVIGEAPEISISLINVKNLTCFGSNDGTATVLATGGTGAFTYVWSNGKNGASVTGLVAGINTVTVTDANKCKKSLAVEITQPISEMAFTKTTIEAKCFDGTGSASVTVSGGTIPYTYLWSNGETSNSISNVPPGTYTVQIKDDKGCGLNPSIEIVSPPEILIEPLIVNVKCKGLATGRVLLNVTKGIAPYRYLWSNGDKTAQANGLLAGTYTVTVTDVTNCSKTIEIQITEPIEKLSIYSNTKNVSCFDRKDGNLTIYGSGGISPYSYQFANTETIQSIENLGAGKYPVTIIDANGCRVDSNFVVTQPEILKVTSNILPILCKGSSTNIYLDIQGGTPLGGENPYYNVVWSDGNTSGSRNFGVFAGNYQATITDQLGCTVSTSMIVKEPLVALSISTDAIPEKCFGSADGVAVVTTVGGTAPYTYLWSSGETTPIKNKYQGGSYSVTVTDKNGCKITKSGSEYSPEPLTLNLVGQNVYCNGGKDGKITVKASGGTWPYEVDFNGEYFLDFSRTDYAVVEGLSPKTYGVVLRDKNGCKPQIEKITLTQPDKHQISILEEIQPTGFGISDGKFTIAIKGGTPGYTNVWSLDGKPFNNYTENDNITTISSARSGNYTIQLLDANYQMATDKTGCTATLNYFLKQPLKLEANAYPIAKPSCAGKVDGILSAKVTGGVVFITDAYLASVSPLAELYKVKWFKKENGVLIDLKNNSSNVENAEAGIYVLKVEDKNANKGEFELVLNPTPTISATLSVATLPTCKNTEDGMLTIGAITGGEAPYDVTWNKGLKGLSISKLAPGNYFAVIKDKNGCFGEVAAVLKEQKEFVINLISQKDACKGFCDGELNVNVTGSGSLSPYQFNWSNNISLKKQTKLCAGSYTATVSLFGGCKVEKTFVVKEPEKAFTVEVSDDISICKDISFELNATQVEGKTYKWTLPDGKNLTTPVSTIDQKGDYLIEVTNNIGCKASDKFNVNITNFQSDADFALASRGYVGDIVYAVNLFPDYVRKVKWRAPLDLEIYGDNFDKLIFIAKKPGVYKIELIVKEAECEAVISKTIIIEAPRKNSLVTTNQVVQIPEINYNIYPNPSDGQFSIETDQELDGTLELHLVDNITGATLASKELKVNHEKIIPVDFSSLLYNKKAVVLILIHNNKKQTKRLFLK